MACQNIERIYNEIAEKKYPDLVEARKKAEEGKRRAEEGKRQAEEEISELKSKANTTARNLLQMGISAQIVSRATGMSEIEVLALMDV